MSVFDAIKDGREAVLKALLESNAKRYDSAERDADAKALSIELRDIVRELSEIEQPDVSNTPSTGIDELRLRREKRLKERKSS